MNALPGRSAPSAPAPAGNDVQSRGRSTSTQCQKPLGVGASGSNTVTTKLLVSSGKPDHDSCGEVSPNSLTWSSLSGWPSAMSSLVTVNDGTAGSRSYGSGLTGRSRLIEAPVGSVSGDVKVVRAVVPRHALGPPCRDDGRVEQPPPYPSGLILSGR